jgi:hypothetical protein
MSRAAERLAVVALLGLMFGLTVAGSWNHSAIYDEPFHLGAGVARVAGNDHRLAPDNPPLEPELAALAALGRLPADKLDPRGHPAFPRIDGWDFGRRLLFEGSRADGDAALRRGRAAVAAVAALGGWLTWWTARRLLGREAGLAALLVLALDPAWLAHGGLITTDMAPSVAFLATIVAAARAFAPAPSRAAFAGRVALLGLAGGALALSKFSAPLVLPVLLVMGVVALVQGARARALGRSVAPVALATALAVPIAAGGIWCGYGLRWSAVADPAAEEPFFLTAQPHGSTDAAFARFLEPPGSRPIPGRAAVELAWRRRLLPQAFVYGFAESYASTRRRASFLAGDHFETGRLAYFPVAFASKTPVGLMALLLIGAAALLLERRRRRTAAVPVDSSSGASATTTSGDAGASARPEQQLLAFGGAAFVAIYSAASLTAPINLGHRHLLPLAPWLALLAGAAWSGASVGRVVKLLRLVALAWLALANLRAFPNYLGSFNELVGGPAGGRRLLVDSNVDWGQDLVRLAEWQQREGVRELLLSRFGTAPPAFYGVRARELPSQQPFGGVLADPWEPGVYAIAATQFESVYFVAGRRESWDDDAQRAYLRAMESDPRRLGPRDRRVLAELAFGRLLVELHERRREPDAIVGTSTLIFRIGEAEMAEMRRASLKPPGAR